MLKTTHTKPDHEHGNEQTLAGQEEAEGVSEINNGEFYFEGAE